MDTRTPLRSTFPPHKMSSLLGDDSKDDADLWIINSCTVKGEGLERVRWSGVDCGVGPSESGMMNLVQTGRKLGKKLVVSGCVPQGDRHNKQIKDLSAIGTQITSNFKIHSL